MPRKKTKERESDAAVVETVARGFDLTTGTRANGMVIGVMPRHASVLVGDDVRVCMLPPRLHGNAMAVGDRVTVGVDARIGWETHVRVNGVIGVRLGR